MGSLSELYRNGNGIYGARTVAREHFHKNASKLTPEECALIAASLLILANSIQSRPGTTCLKTKEDIFIFYEMRPYISAQTRYVSRFQ